jgi:hypothetical protein
LIDAVRRNPQDPIRPEEPPRLHCREILLPHVRSIRPCRQGQIQSIVDDEEGAVRPAEEPDGACLREQFAQTSRLVAKLDHIGPADQGRPSDL